MNNLWITLITTIHGIHVRRNVHTRTLIGSDGLNYNGVKVLYYHDGKLKHMEMRK